MEFLHKLSIHQHIQQGKQRIRLLAAAPGRHLPQQLFQRITRITPNAFSWTLLPEAAQEGKQSLLILWLHGFTTQERKPGNVGGFATLNDFFLRGGGKGLTVVKVPGYGIKAVFAPVGTAGNKQAGTNPRTVGNVIMLDIGVVHPLNYLPYRWSTRSLISWVRPWFQNWVPI